MEANICSLEAYKFGNSSLNASPNEIKFHTGFEIYEMLKATFLALQPTAAAMIRWTQIQQNNGCLVKYSDKGFTSKVPLLEQLFTFNCFMKAGLMETDLSSRAKISVATTSRIIITWAKYLYCVLCSPPIWPSRVAIDKNMPESFKELLKCKVIIDCTEIKCQTPAAGVLNSMFYSQYKNHTTLKGFVGIAPFGAVTFVSELYTGLISDKDITKR